MKKSDKLFTANKWNKPQFARNVDRVHNNIFDGEYSSQIPEGFTFTQSQIDSLGTPDYMQEIKSLSKKGFGSGKGASYTSAALSAIPETNFKIKGVETKRGVWDAADPMYWAAGGRESAAGNAVSDFGVSLAKNSGGNPWLLAAAGLTKMIGGGINLIWGNKYNQGNIDRINNENAAMTSQGDAYRNANSWEDVNSVGSVRLGSDIDYNDIVDKVGLSHYAHRKARRQVRRLKSNQKNAETYAAGALQTTATNVDNSQDNDVLAKTIYADGGFLGQPMINSTGMGAIDYGFMSDYLLNKTKQVENKNSNITNPFAGAPSNIFALGGDVQMHGADFTTGLTQVNAGGSHEESPYDGVQIGIAPDSKPNLVEEGETVFNDYVYSNRISIDDETKKRFHISKKRDMTYADLSKKLEKESAERPNDPISKAALKLQMQQLAEQQERQKKEIEAQKARDAFEALTPEEQTSLMQYAQQVDNQEQAMQEQAVMEQMAAQQGQPSEEELMQQQMMQEAPQEYAEGGHIYSGGGALEWLNKKYPKLKNKEEIAKAMEALAKTKSYTVTNTTIDKNGQEQYSTTKHQGIQDWYKTYLDITQNGWTGHTVIYTDNSDIERAKEYYQKLRKLGLSHDTAAKYALPETRYADQQKIRASLLPEFDKLYQSTPKGKKTVYTSNDGKVFSTLKEARDYNAAHKTNQGEHTEPQVSDTNPDSAVAAVTGNNASSASRGAGKANKQPSSAGPAPISFEEPTGTYNPETARNNIFSKLGLHTDKDWYDWFNNNQVDVVPSRVSWTPDEASGITPPLEAPEQTYGDNWQYADALAGWNPSTQSWEVGNEPESYIPVTWNAKDHPIESTDWTSLIGNQRFRDAMYNTTQDAALRDAIERGYDFGNYTAPTAPLYSMLAAPATWDDFSQDNWKDSQDKMYLEAVQKGLIKEGMTDAEFEDALKSTDAYKNTTNLLSRDENARKYYLQQMLGEEASPGARKHALQFIDENGNWKEGISHTYDDIFKGVRDTQPGNYWHTLEYNPRKKTETNYVINDDGTVEVIYGDVPTDWTDAGKYSWQTDEGDIAANYYRRPSAAGSDTDTESTDTEDSDGSGTSEIEPVHKASWLRYSGLLGPAVGLGMQLAGVGKPNYKGLDAALDIVNNGGAQADYKPIGNYLKYTPMDIWANQNRKDANARAADRAILNRTAPTSTVMSGLIANNYNNQLGSANLYRQALEYNDANRARTADFNRGTDMFNAQAYNQNQQFNAAMRNRQNQLRASLAMDAARTKLAMDNDWYRSIYGNVGGIFEGLGDIGRENLQHNMIADMAADELFGKLTPGKQYVGTGYVRNKNSKKGSKSASKGGKINRKRGLTF